MKQGPRGPPSAKTVTPPGDVNLPDDYCVNVQHAQAALLALDGPKGHGVGTRIHHPELQRRFRAMWAECGPAFHVLTPCHSVRMVRLPDGSIDLRSKWTDLDEALRGLP